MASDLNSNTIVGRMTKDVEIKTTGGGMVIANISIASNYSKKQGDQWTEEVNYFDVRLFGRRAEALAQYLLKGTQIAVSGELRQERWESDGQKRSRVVINANNIQLLGSKGSTNNNSSNGQQSYSKPVNGGATSYSSTNGQTNSNSFESDIPF